MRPFNPRSWNLLKPAGVLALTACGPGGLEGESTDVSDETNATLATTVDSYTTYDDYWDSYTDYTDYSDWSDDYYDPCNYCAPDELCDGYMCYTPGCEDSFDCGEGTVCVEGDCVPLPESLTCGSWPTVGITVPPVDTVLDLSFVDIDNDDDDELVMLTTTGVSVLDDDLSLVETAFVGPAQFTRVHGIRVDGDEFIDLAFTDPEQGGIRTLIGNGDGSFGAELDEALEPIVDALALDTNLDGQDELIGLIDGMPALVDGVGEAVQVSPLAPSEPHQRLVHGDTDGDGQRDLLLAGLVGDLLLQSAVWILQQDGAWAPGTEHQQLALDQPSYWGAFDLDGDGLDNAFAAGEAGVVVMQSWSRGIPAVASVPESGLTWILGLEFDGTNGEELLLGTTNPRLVQRLNADPIGCSYPLENFPSGGQRAVAGDFSGDGIDEVAVLVDGVVEIRVSDF